MVDRILSFLVALSLAFLVWLYARSREQEILDNVPIPVDVTLTASQADQYILDVTGPSQVSVSFAGPPARIRELRGMLQRGELRVDMKLTVPEDRQQAVVETNVQRAVDIIREEAGDEGEPDPGVAFQRRVGRASQQLSWSGFTTAKERCLEDTAEQEKTGAGHIGVESVVPDQMPELVGSVRHPDPRPVELHRPRSR